MQKISAPNPNAHPGDRHIRCQDAMQGAFRELVDAATAAGWTEREAVSAIVEMADNHMLSIAAADETQALIAMIKRMT